MRGYIISGYTKDNDADTNRENNFKLFSSVISALRVYGEIRNSVRARKIEGNYNGEVEESWLFVVPDKFEPEFDSLMSYMIVKFRQECFLKIGKERLCSLVYDDNRIVELGKMKVDSKATENYSLNKYNNKKYKAG